MPTWFAADLQAAERGAARAAARRAARSPLDDLQASSVPQRTVHRRIIG